MSIAYILQSEVNKKFYYGSSHKDDINFRLSYHNGGKVKSTKNGKPWKVVHLEKFETYREARQKENYFKSGKGRNWIYDTFK